MIATKDWILSSRYGAKELTLTLTVFGGDRRKKLIHMSISEFDMGLKAYQEGACIQDAFPTLSAAEREFMLTGTYGFDVGEGS